jgi:hypothetical protein
LYVIHHRGKPIYVGVTRQPIANRLRYGWSARGLHGYHGYAWRKAFKSVGLDIWFQEDATARSPKHEIEAVEAEVVFLIRQRGQWPKYQTEIHFYPSRAVHRRAARKVMSLYA